MSRIIAVANVKGGAGKTTTTGNLAAALVERGRRVLAIDLDPQASLTHWFAPDVEHLDKTIQIAISYASASVSSLLVSTQEHFDLVPAAHDLLLAERELIQGGVRVNAVRNALEPLRTKYDFLLIDCPADAGILTGNALIASDQVIIPFLPEYPSLHALEWLLSLINEMQREMHPNLQVLGLFLSNYDPRLRHTRYVIDYVQKKYGSQAPFFSAAVHQSVTLRQAALHKTSIFCEAPNSQAANAYRALAQEVEEGVQRQPPEDINQILDQAVSALVEHDQQKAYVHFSAVTQTNPAVIEGWIGRGRSAQEWEESVRCFAEALSIDPDSSKARAELESSLDQRLQASASKDIPQIMAVAHYLSAAGFREYADRAFARVLELDPAHQEAWSSRARIAGTLKQAVLYYERSLELNPNDTLARRELETIRSRAKAEAFAIVEYSQSMMRAGSHDEAHTGFLQATEIDPNNEQAWIGCARTTSDVAQALVFVERALQVNPRNPEGIELREWLRSMQSQQVVARKQPSLLLIIAISGVILLLLLMAGLFLLDYLKG